MGEQITIFEVMKTILFWLSPLIFLEGMLLLVVKADKHIKLEQRLGKEMGIKIRLIPRIETNIFTFQNWLLKKSSILGLFFIIYSFMLFIVLKG